MMRSFGFFSFVQICTNEKVFLGAGDLQGHEKPG